MSKKAIIIGIVFVLIGVFAFLGYYYHDSIQKYIEEESWIYTEPYVKKKIETANAYINGSFLYVIRDNILNIYNKNLEQVSSESLGTMEVSYAFKGPYVVLASNEKKFLSLYKDSKLVWNKNTELDIKEVSVNKNGFVSVIFTQNRI